MDSCIFNVLTNPAEIVQSTADKYHCTDFHMMQTLQAKSIIHLKDHGYLIDSQHNFSAKLYCKMQLVDEGVTRGIQYDLVLTCSYRGLQQSCRCGSTHTSPKTAPVPQHNMPIPGLDKRRSSRTDHKEAVVTSRLQWY